MNRQPYGTPPKWWAPKMSVPWVRLSHKYRKRRLFESQNITEIETIGGHHLRDAVRARKGVLLAPNHSAHYDSAALYLAADTVDVPLFFMTAWQVFAMSGKVERWAMQRLGAFSINRESTDRQAFKQAIRILQHEKYPLVIFPEGDIYHVTDCVTPFREGAAAIALSAAKKAEREIVVVPCGIKFWYVTNPMRELVELMHTLEDRVFLRPRDGTPLNDRIHRLAEAMLALKELDYLGTTESGRVRDRLPNLACKILQQLEQRHEIHTPPDNIPERVKVLRQEIITKGAQTDANVDSQANGSFQEPDPSRKQLLRSLEKDMEDLFFVMQLYSYPGDYLLDNPSVERIAETLDKFEEDILGLELPTVRGRRRVTIEFGEPIPIAAGKSRRGATAELTNQMHAAVQGLVDGLNDKFTSLDHASSPTHTLAGAS